MKSTRNRTNFPIMVGRMTLPHLTPHANPKEALRPCKSTVAAAPSAPRPSQGLRVSPLRVTRGLGWASAPAPFAPEVGSRTGPPPRARSGQIGPSSRRRGACPCGTRRSKPAVARDEPTLRHPTPPPSTRTQPVTREGGRPLRRRAGYSSRRGHVTRRRHA